MIFLGVLLFIEKLGIYTYLHNENPLVSKNGGCKVSIGLRAGRGYERTFTPEEKLSERVAN